MIKWKALTNSYDEAVNKLSQDVMNGTPGLENLRCVFKLNDDESIHVLTVFDLIDLDPPKDTVKNFTLYQLFNEN
jgi:hypothetical protein